MTLAKEKRWIPASRGGDPILAAHHFVVSTLGCAA